MKDTGRVNLDNIAKRLEVIEHSKINVGILADAPHPGPDGRPASLLAIATGHEFGPESGAKVPKRSFLRATADDPKTMDGIEDKLKTGIQEILQGKGNVAHLLKEIGAFVVGEVQERISRGIAPALSQKTLDAKKAQYGEKRAAGAVPLIDTGRLRQSIASEVVKR